MIDQEPRGQGFTEAWVEAALSVGVLAVVEAAAGGGLGKPQEVEMAVLRIRYDGSFGILLPSAFRPL